MKTLLLIVALTVTLVGCGGKSDTTSKADAAAKVQVDVARATLQEKADALARQASVSPPPASDNKKK